MWHSQESVSPTLLALSCLPSPFLDILNQQTTNHFPLLTPGSPNENTVLSSGKTRPGPRAAPSPLLPVLPPGGHKPAAVVVVPF